MFSNGLGKSIIAHELPSYSIKTKDYKEFSNVEEVARVEWYVATRTL